MDELLTIAEIESRYRDEWILVEDPQTNESLEVLAGRVLCHSHNRDDIDPEDDGNQSAAAVRNSLYGRDSRQYGRRAMSFPFAADKGLIIVRAAVVGPEASLVVRLALDTGATTTLINVDVLLALGYDPSLAEEHIEVTTGSGVEFTPRLAVNSVTALGVRRLNFPVLGHTLPPSAPIDGLLGLDFLRGCVLTVDFVAGTLTLVP